MNLPRTRPLTRRDFKLWESSSFQYWKGTRANFGFHSALCTLSPFYNLVTHIKSFRYRNPSP